MSDILYLFFSRLTPGQATEFFIILMLCLAGASLVCRVVGRGRGFVEQTPGLLTSLGILGTFVGIIIGLFDFSLEDIDRSIAILMGGLKTAFLTSVVGLSLSLLVRVVTRLIPSAGDPKPTTTTIDDLNQSMVRLGERMEAALDRLASETSTALVRELSRVVESFNQKLQVQFGENLNRFASQLGELAPMLEQSSAQYREQADRVVDWVAQCEAQLGMLQAEQANLLALHDRIGLLPSLCEGIAQLSEMQKAQITEAAQLLDAQHKTAEAIGQLLPAQQQTLADLGAQLGATQKAIDNNLAATHKVFSTQVDAIEQRFAALEQLTQRLSLLDPARLQAMLEEGAGTHRQAMQELAQSMATTHREMQQALAETIRQDIANTAQSLRQHYGALDGKVREEMDLALSGMGEALASISGQFTRDYHQLIAQMQRILAVPLPEENRHAS